MNNARRGFVEVRIIGDKPTNSLVIVSSAKDMGSADLPNNNEGWGRLLLDNALFFEGDTRELVADDVTPGLSTGETWSKAVTVDSGAIALTNDAANNTIRPENSLRATP